MQGHAWPRDPQPITCLPQVTAHIIPPSPKPLRSAPARPHRREALLCPPAFFEVEGWERQRGKGRDNDPGLFLQAGHQFAAQPIKRGQKRLGDPGKSLANKILPGLLAHSWSQIFQLPQPQL